MFIGHFALGFAAKRVAPRLSLATLFVAAQLADVIWPVLVMVGVEQVRIAPGITAFTPLEFISYPYSHSLLMLCVWGAVFGALCVRANRDRLVPLMIAALVVSHWVLDWITHVPDMPLYPGSAKVGLGLWNSVAATIRVEVLMFVAGLCIYARTTRPRDAVGRVSLAAFAVFLLIVYLAAAFGPPPPSVTAVVVTGTAGAAVIFLWAWWLDRHRIGR
jgi:hypothetical protein